MGKILYVRPPTFIMIQDHERLTMALRQRHCLEDNCFYFIPALVFDSDSILAPPDTGFCDQGLEGVK